MFAPITLPTRIRDSLRNQAITLGIPCSGHFEYMAISRRSSLVGIKPPSRLLVPILSEKCVSTGRSGDRIKLERDACCHSTYPGARL